MSGNGFSDPADDFGIGVIGTGTGNVIDGNIVVGNTQGIVLQAGARGTVVRDNTVVGNPPIQTSNTHTALRGLDIVNLAPTGETRFEGNVCVSSVNAPCPAPGAPRPQQ